MPVRPDKLPVVILISGRGSNLQAILDQAAGGILPIDIRAVISNVPGAYGLERARQAGIETQVLSHKGFADREAYDRALIELIDRYAPGLVVLAGFMRILTPAFVRHYARRLLNIHPSLLPRHRGLNTHARALEEGDAEHGASVHLVTEELDGGPVLIQARVPVHPGDDPEVLAARVLEQEHRLYPEAIRWFAEGRIDFDGEQVRLDGRPLTEPVQLQP
ncbi:MAG TPA: phosphoribosylglycinamide formyltransferase [Thiohalobacter sp.]|nr:phosphoribosylglycinamide formyltransferase [Thiohalobacter sp.]